MNPHQYTIKKRILSYWLVAGGLLFLYVLLRGSNWKGNTELHTLMEVVAFLLAIMVGIMHANGQAEV